MHKVYRIALLCTLGCTVSCFQVTFGDKMRFEDTYPGDMGILSMYKQPIYVVDCEGLGGAQPDGLIIARAKPEQSPQASYYFPRLDHLPSEFTIRWRTAATSEELRGTESRPDDFTQRVAFPKGIKGAKAQILFILDENNVWSCELRDEHDWTKPYVPPAQ